MASRRQQWGPYVVFALVVVLASSAVAYDWLVVRPSGPRPPAPPVLVEGTTPIQRVIVLMKENHGFDNYFGTFPGVDGLPANVTLPDGSGGSVAPHWLDASSTPDLPHDRAAMLQSYDNGLNDQFAVVSNQAGLGLGNISMGYYDGRELPATWTLARNFTIADRYFASFMGPTLPNRLYSIAGQAPGVTSNSMPFGGIDMPTIFDQLQARGITWRYYAFNDFLNGALPLAIGHIAHNSTLAANVVPMSRLVGDIAAGTFPSVTYIDPEGVLPADIAIDDHPPGDVSVGDAWTASIVGAIRASSMWLRSAILLTWDESGGFYDHVPPPQVDPAGYGFRVPMLIISPYSKRGFVDQDVMDHTSILKLIAVNWNLPMLTPREANVSDMLSAFTFPSAPMSAGSSPLAGGGLARVLPTTHEGRTLALIGTADPRRVKDVPVTWS